MLIVAVLEIKNLQDCFFLPTFATSKLHFQILGFEAVVSNCLKKRHSRPAHLP